MTDPRSSDLAGGVAAVIEAGLGVGAAIAKATAQATARSGAVTAPPRPGALNAMIHHGLATVVNVVGLVGGAVNGARPSAASAPREAGASPQRPTRPRVHEGATLRIPLSIENPGNTPMTASFRCSSVVPLTGPAPGADAAAALAAQFVRLTPPLLEIQPRDFEKLTVYIEIPPGTPTGPYRAVLRNGDDPAETVIDFDVIEGEG